MHACTNETRTRVDTENIAPNRKYEVYALNTLLPKKKWSDSSRKSGGGGGRSAELDDLDNLD